MINITRKEICCGCGACVQKCPKSSITFIEDNEGFLYPTVDSHTCVDCGICETVCHELHPYDEHTPLKVLAAHHVDLMVRQKSSSGGIFTLLAEKIISEGGVVFGARFDDDWQVILDYTETLNGLVLFRGSKYVQARTEKAYIDAKRFLESGRKVLFSGTPCQIAGLHHFLMKPFDNLLTVDFVCHGVPSPKVWRNYLGEITMDGTSKVVDVQFRNKRNGWKHFGLSVDLINVENFTTQYSWHQENPYMRAFLCNLILRPSCYDCKAKQGRSGSDITVADYWGVEKKYPEIDDDKGISLVLINSRRGKMFFKTTSCFSIEIDYYDAEPYNPGLASKPNVHPNRDKFFGKINDSLSTIELIDYHLKPAQPNIIFRLKHKCLCLIRKFKNVL